MNVMRLLIAAGFGVALLGTTAAPTQSAEPAAKAPEQAAETPTVNPDAVKALDTMGAYLRTLQSFQITSTTERDEIEDNGQKLQFGATVTYKVQRPNAFYIELAEERRQRQIFYDGKSLTVFAPRMGFYTSIPAPATIRETLNTMAERYNITVPLDDLFAWGADGDKHDNLTAGYVVGFAKINGQDADQYAFRQKGVDWQIWIARGSKPLPLRVVITSLSDPTQPQFESTLAWNTDAKFSPETFAFKPPANAKKISIVVAQR